MPKFKVGEVVKLRSGGPLMTVTYVRPKTVEDCYECYECMWFNSGKVEACSFPEEALLSGENSYTKPGGPDMTSG